MRHETVGLRQTVLRFKAHKFYCYHCQRYFNQRFPGILPYQRASEKLREEIFHYHTHGISQKTLAIQFKLGKATVERWYHQGFQRKNQHMSGRHCPRVLGIDEHFFFRKQGYATTLCDLRQHKIFDLLPGHNESSLADYLHALPGKERVQVVYGFKHPLSAPR